MKTFLDLLRVARGCERREFMIYTTYTKKPDKICAELHTTFFLKTLDKSAKREYNKYRKRERKKVHTMMNRYQDNWFDVMFDKAIEALEREAEERGE